MNNNENPDHIFIQCILATPNISEKELIKNFEAINLRLAPAFQRSLKQVRAYAERVLFPLGLELKRFADDNFCEGAFSYVIVSTEPFSDHLNRISIPSNRASQIKDMIGLMFEDARCRGIPYAHMTSAKFPAKKEIVKQLLLTRRLVKLGSAIKRESSDDVLPYFEDDEDEIRATDQLMISTAFSLELSEYLQSEFSGKTLFACAGCKHWVLQGRLCSNEDCNMRLHERCYAPYFDVNSFPIGICPECNSNI